MKGRKMTSKQIDIAFLVGSGRVNLNVEQACFDVLSADGMRDWVNKMKHATTQQVDAIWGIVKATPAGANLK
jgi:hypothetical protein